MLDQVSSQTTKNRIMDAAEDIVLKLGASHLTFDELVKSTKLSKGGILYHYPSKKELLRAMIRRMVDGFENRRRELAKNMQLEGMGGVDTYIRASFDASDRDHSATTSLMAAAASDPELLEIVRDHYKRNFAEMRATGDKALWSMMIFMAVDGVWLLDAFGLCMMDESERKGMKDMLLKISKQEPVLGDKHD